MISTNCKAIFIHVPKCAGRSITDAFSIEKFDHFTSNYYIQKYPTLWKKYFKFTIVRNPLSRFVSMYHYLANPANDHLNDEITFFGNMPDFKTWLRANIENYRGNYNPYSEEGMREEDGLLGSAFWFGSQHQRLCDENGYLDPDIFIFNFQSDIERIPFYVRLFCDGSEIRIPHLNADQHSFRKHHLFYYDLDLIRLARNFEPVRADCEQLRIKLIL